LKYSMRGVSINIFAAAIILLLLTSCSEMFEDRIGFTAESVASLDDLFGTADTSDKLQTPSQFYIPDNFSNSIIKLTWNSVANAAYYMVERAVVPPVQEEHALIWNTPDDDAYEPLDRFVYVTSFIDEILRNPALDSPEYMYKYFYRVSAFNTAKKFEESETTAPQSAMLLRAPGGLKASGGISVDYIRLDWDKLEGAVSYEVWRSDFPNGASASLIATVYGNQYWYQNEVSAAEQGKDFYYMIAAKNSHGNKSLLTRPAYGYAKIAGAPDAPANVRVEKGRGHSTNEIIIKWDPVNENGVYYAVYRFSSVDSSLTRLTDKTEDTSYSDKVGLRPGIYYYYRIQAIVDDIASGSALRSQFSTSDPEGFVLSSPETVVAEKAQSGSVTVKWLPAMGNENERLEYTYNIFADNSMNGSFSAKVVQGVSYNSADAQGFISSSVSAGYSYFKVSTVNGAVESEKSIVVSPAPDAAVIQEVSRHANIPNTTANSSGVFPVRITWKKPENDTPAFYHVQRSNRSGTGFSRVNETALPANGPFNDIYSYNNSTGVYTFIDRNDLARAGRKYYYRVLSLNQLEQGNFPSNELIGWGALTHTQYILEYNKTMNAALKKLTYMHRPGSTDKLGTETKNGSIGGTVYYNAAISGLGARIIIRLTNYQEFYIENDPANGVYFILSGESNTSANMSSNGTMDGTVTCTGMYPGRIIYNKIEIKGGAAGGGAYGVQPDGFQQEDISYTILN